MPELQPVVFLIVGVVIVNGIAGRIRVPAPILLVIVGVAASFIPGVPDYALPRMGERFFTTARPGGERSGSGLGLAIVKRVMALHGGKMVVRNTAPGLQVRLEFPTV